MWVPEAAGPDDRLPVVVFFHGGGWDSGDRTSYGFAGRALATEGFVAVVPDYRLVPRAHWPDFLQDGAAAVAWVQAHIASLGGGRSEERSVGKECVGTCRSRGSPFH